MTQHIGSPVPRQVIAHVDLVSNEGEHELVQGPRQPQVTRPNAEEMGTQFEWHIPDPAMYQMSARVAVELDDGRRINGDQFSFTGPTTGLGAICHRYRGPKLSADPTEHIRLLDETYRVGVADIEAAINEALGRERDQQHPPPPCWDDLLEALTSLGASISEAELTALPLTIELSDRVKAFLAPPLD